MLTFSFEDGSYSSITLVKYFQIVSINYIESLHYNFYFPLRKAHPLSKGLEHPLVPQGATPDPKWNNLRFKSSVMCPRSHNSHVQLKFEFTSNSSNLYTAPHNAVELTM